MRLNKGTIALLVLSLVVIIAASVLSNQPPATPTITPTVAATNTGPVFAAIDTSTVNRFEVVDNTTSQRTVLTRDAALVWSVAETTVPGTTAVDQARINTQLGNFTTLNATDRFVAANAVDFGLDTPAFTISITRLDGTVNTVQVGNTNPGASRYYVLVDGQPDVVLVQQAIIAGVTSMVANPPYVPLPTATPGTVTPDTRRPLLTSVTADQMTSLVIRDNTTGASTTLAKDASLNWAITATNTTTRPTDQFASFTAAANFTGLAYTDSFGPNDLPVFRLEDFGLDTASYTIIATTATWMQYTLTVGGMNPSSTEYYTLLSSVQLALPTSTPMPTVEATADESTAEGTAEATAAVLEATAEATVDVTAEVTAEATAEGTVEATAEATTEATAEATAQPIVVYLIPRATIDALVALIAAPPYLPAPTATPEATAEVTVSADVTAEATAEATTESTTEATAEATTAP